MIELGELKEWRERIEEHGRMLKERLKEIEQRRTDREQEIRLLEGVEEFLASIWEALEEPTFETKQKVLRLVVDRIVVEGSKVVVHHVVPTGPVYLQTERQLVNRETRRLTLSLSVTSSTNVLLGTCVFSEKSIRCYCLKRERRYANRRPHPPR